MRFGINCAIFGGIAGGGGRVGAEGVMLLLNALNDVERLGNGGLVCSCVGVGSGCSGGAMTVVGRAGGKGSC